ncbi:MAG: cation:proton antiporter [Candidatus Eremiobacteraeota bacterium]|nr:cation:proton antiporter [Candidatus Eremiobacteraeota bacterium]
MPKQLSEHEVLILLVALPLFVALARLCGEVAVRLRQPQVLGEVLAGVVLGPSLLGIISKSALHTMQHGAQLVEPFSWAGIILLLALTGMEMKFGSLRREAKPALFATVGGVILPFAGGLLLALTLPASLIGSSGSRVAFSLFLALAMSISAVSVIAKVLTDLGQMRRTASKIILAGGVFDETLGWILLALVSGIASASVRPGGATGSAQTVPILLVVIKTAVFLGCAFLFGRRLVSWILRIIRTYALIDVPVFSVTIVLALAFSAITEALGLHQILGAFVFGVIAANVPRIDRVTVENIRVLTRGFLVPLFFVLAGMRVDLTQLSQGRVIPIAAAFIGIAVAGKLIGCTLGGLLGRMPWREALLVGIGMNVRGSMEIVVAVLGLSLGILSPIMFSVIVLLSVVTILVVPSVMRVAFRFVPPSSEERARIEREEQDEHAYTPQLRRVLVPLLPRTQSEAGPEFARALTRSKAHADEPLEIVVLRIENSSNNDTTRDRAERKLVDESKHVQGDEPIDVEEHEATGDRPDGAILNAAERGGFQLIVVGAAPPRHNGALFGATIDSVIRNAPCDTLVVSSSVEFQIEHVRRIVVPFTGREAARAAGDLALALASGLGATVYAISVVPQLPAENAAAYEQMQRRERTASESLRELEDRARVLEVHLESRIERAALPARTILGELEKPDVGLCLLGASEQSARGTPFFGDTADLVLRYAPTPVALLVPKSG